MIIQLPYISRVAIHIMVAETPCYDLVFSVADLANNHLPSGLMHPIVNFFIEHAKLFIQHCMLRHASELVALPVPCIFIAKTMQSNKEIDIEYFFISARPQSWCLNTRQ